MKQSKDSRDVFAVFKKGSFMEDASFGEKFRYWFKNVYWYHFRYQTLLVVVLLICSVVFINDVVFREYNDLDYILAGNVFASSETMQTMEDRISDLIETEGEEPPTIGRQLLTTRSVMGTGDLSLKIDEYASASIEKIAVSMADDDILLFFFDKKYTDWYAAEGAFEPLANFGIESENEFFIRVDDASLFADLNISHTDGIYAGIKVINKSRRKNERIMAKYDVAARVVAGILNAG